MSGGVVAVVYLLKNNAPLVAAVVAENIAASVIPLGTVLPAIGVSEISTVERRIISMNETRVRATSRIQVTVQTKSYPTQKSILELVRKACPHTHGTVNGIVVDSILPDVVGPDLRDDDEGVFMQSRDFMVSFYRDA